MSVSERSQAGFVQNVPGHDSCQLELQDSVCGGRHTLLLTGELDIASCPVLDVALAELCTDGTSAVVLDLRKLTFMDSTGIHAVLVAKELSDAHGCELLVIAGQPQVLRVFAASGLLDHLPLQIDNVDPGCALSGTWPQRNRLLTASRFKTFAPSRPVDLVRRKPRFRVDPHAAGIDEMIPTDRSTI
jgi:anti-anti-sigma factor